MNSYRFPVWRLFLMVTAVILIAVQLSPVTCLAAAGKPLMRFPDVGHGRIVFVYGDDIWTVPEEGGVASRLTINDGTERFPKFSPDGSMIAFTGEYDGNSDVYVMNVYGGDITRVTYHPAEDVVVGWHPTENKIMFRSARKSFSRFYRLFLISPDGTHPEELIMHEAVQGSYSPDGKKIAYNRVPREFRTWKRYRGGTAQQIYLFDFEEMKDTRLTEFPGTDRIPMWHQNSIYFSSDRSGVLNIFSYNLDSGEVNQITSHTSFDVRRPSIGGEKIVYELGGSLHLLDIESGETAEVPVRIETDTPELRPVIIDVKDLITSVDCSPSAERALITARGEVFTVPKEHGPTRNLSMDSGSRERGAVWSPDGRKIAYFSDSSGEYEIYVRYMTGDRKTVKLTDLGHGYRHTLLWSPDSRKLAFADQTLACYYIDVEDRDLTFVDRAEFENVDVSLNRKPIHDFCWSPDSRYLAYSKMTGDQIYQVYIYSLDNGKTHCISNGLFKDFGPVFSKDGRHLFFVSNRRFDPTFCDFDWEMVYKDAAAICCLTLREDGDPLLEFRSDEVEVADGGKEEEEDKDTSKVEIDFEGIESRLEMLPLPGGNYRELSASGKCLFYLNKDEGDFNHFEFRAVGPMDLCRFDFEEREEKKVIPGIDSYRLSADEESIVYRKGHDVGIISAGVTDSAGDNLDLSGLTMKLDPLAEWKQMYYEAWRMERDFYYEPNMQGLDWEAMRDRYAELLPSLSCRSDLRYLIGELIGELNTSHTYVFGGDYRRRAERVNIGLLGVDWAVNSRAGRYSFGKIYRVADWTRNIIPPLAGPGVDVNPGDYLISVNGEDVTADNNIYSYFEGLAGEQVRIGVSSEADDSSPRIYTVEPLRGEYTLRYLGWVEHNRQVAAGSSGGEIGYIHLPDTYLGSAREFPKYFYSQTRKKGLIIDGRFNGGGLNPAIFLRRLRREPLTYWTRRYSHDQTSPAVAVNAHMVCLTNRQAGSGGDELPMEFQMFNMGPVIGTRTWGGLVGVSMWIGLVDGGGISAPDYRIYDRKGRWIVENEGVTPDIVVDLDPVEMSRGYDAQLMKGIEYLKDKIASDPPEWPEHEPFPVDKLNE